MAGLKISFADLKSDNHSWITLATGEFYPDILPHAIELYGPVLSVFGRLLRSSESSARLMRRINQEPSTWMRVQLCRVFRKYVSPRTPVEMLKRKTKVEDLIREFGAQFRPIHEVQRAFDSRQMPDETLCALLWEYKSRGRSGYDLTERFFEMFRSRFADLIIEGPERAGSDIRLRDVFDDYPNPNRPVDFLIRDKSGDAPLAIGLARYDSDRGGAQEDDRVGGYRDCADEILGFSEKAGMNTKMIFLNDGPGLLLGSMWDDYAALEDRWPGKIVVLTLRMVPERLELSWLTE